MAMNNNTETPITIYCTNSSTSLDIPAGASLLDIYRLAGEPLACRPMSARVNGRVESLDFRCREEADIEFVDITHPAGFRTYIRSLCFVLTRAVSDLYPGAAFDLEHSVSKGYYCAFTDRRVVTIDDTARISARMQAIIDADIPFTPRRIRTSDAIELFRRHGMDDKARLVETAGMAYTSYYMMDDYVNSFYGCLTPSSGYLHLFGLIAYEDGMLLQAPRRDNPALLEPFTRQDKMFNAYKEHLILQRTLDLNDVGELNQAVAQGRARRIVMVSEAMQEKQIARIAGEIARQYDRGVRIILISGPSSSGKTTFCRRLEIQLMTNLLHPLGISLDDYYLDREITPRDESGAYDFESLYAIDLPFFYDHLQRLIAGETIDVPTFDFETGRRIFRGQTMQMNRPRQILILEGIHGLNPELTAGLPPEALYRIYVSALTTISLDGHNWIPASDNRLLRRIVRDSRSRGYSARETIAMWTRIRRGEDRWIFPYQENAHATFNSAMIYELAVLRHFAEPLLAGIRETDDESAEACRLLRFLRYFNAIPLEELPLTSLLREFLGGGNLG